MGRSRKQRESRAIPTTERPLEKAEAQPPERTSSIDAALVWITLVLLFAFSLLTLYVPVVRASNHFEVNYNEG